MGKIHLVWQREGPAQGLFQAAPRIIGVYPEKHYQAALEHAAQPGKWLDTREMAEPEPEPDCTHGADCLVHPQIMGLHGVIEVHGPWTDDNGNTWKPRGYAWLKRGRRDFEVTSPWDMKTDDEYGLAVVSDQGTDEIMLRPDLPPGMVTDAIYEARDNSRVTWLSRDGKRIAIVPADIAERGLIWAGRQAEGEFR